MGVLHSFSLKNDVLITINELVQTYMNWFNMNRFNLISFQRTRWFEDVEFADRLIDIPNDLLKSDKIMKKSVSDFQSGTNK